MGNFLLLSSTALKTTVLLVVVAAFSGLLYRSSAAIRHWLWACALTVCLLMPLAILWVPSLAILPSSWAPSETQNLRTAEPSLHSSDGLNAPRMHGETSGLRSGWPTLFMVWWIGAVVLLLRNAVAHAGLVRWLHRAAPLRSGAWIATLQSLSIRPRSRLLILECPADHGPCTWGFVRPVLMLPAGGDAWSESWRRHALLHEQAHLDRRDALTALIARMACALHWFNPLVWFAAAQMRVLQEKACDDAVLRAGVRPSDYAQFLLDMARRKGGEADSPATLGMLGCSPLQTRIRSILDCTRSRTERGRISSLAGLCVLGALSVTLSAIAFVTPSKERSSHISPIASNATARNAAYARVMVSANSIPIIPTAGRPFKNRLFVPVTMHPSGNASSDRSPTAKTHPPRPERAIAPVPPTPAKPALPARPAAPPGTSPLPPLDPLPATPSIPAVAAVPPLASLPAVPPKGAPEHGIGAGCKPGTGNTDHGPGADPSRLDLGPWHFV
jgi:beta-lactamase regulating signal transducer with metallopeptidase domain